jgi:hypothetical protein
MQSADTTAAARAVYPLQLGIDSGGGSNIDNGNHHANRRRDGRHFGKF